MSFRNYFNSPSLLLFFLLLTQNAIACVAEKQCGQYIFQVKIVNGLDISERRFELYYKAPNQPKKLFFRTKAGVYLTARCIQNKKKQDLMLFNEFYGGNIGPEDIYGVFDPGIKKMLIRPANLPTGNSKQVEQIIGYPLPSLDEDDGTTFCCFSHQYQAAQSQVK